MAQQTRPTFFTATILEKAIFVSQPQSLLHVVPSAQFSTFTLRSLHVLCTISNLGESFQLEIKERHETFFEINLICSLSDAVQFQRKWHLKFRI